MQPDQPSPPPPLADIAIEPGMPLPLPDDAAALAAQQRLTAIDIGVSAPTVTAIGTLANAVIFVAGVQGSPYPRPLLSTRVVLMMGSHAGAGSAGGAPDPRDGIPLQHLATTAGAARVTLDWQPASAPIELQDAITEEQMETALRAGWAEAERAADEGNELIVLAAGGAGSATAAAAVAAAATGAEPSALLGRVVTPGGVFDDNAWMTRCAALRDAMFRVRDRVREPRTLLCALGGADISAATGLILGAASRRTPVMIDGPVGAAAALVANLFSPAARRWLMLPDTGRHPTVYKAAEALGLVPWLDLCLDMGEGAASLASLPLLQTALTLAGTGTPTEPKPPARYDSTGNQIFVGVARPVPAAAPPAEPAAEAEEAEEAAPAPDTQGPEPQAPDTQGPEPQAPETQAPETQAAEAQEPPSAPAAAGEPREDEAEKAVAEAGEEGAAEAVTKPRKVAKPAGPAEPGKTAELPRATKRSDKAKAGSAAKASGKAAKPGSPAKTPAQGRGAPTAERPQVKGAPKAVPVKAVPVVPEKTPKAKAPAKAAVKAAAKAAAAKVAAVKAAATKATPVKQAVRTETPAPASSASEAPPPAGED